MSIELENHIKDGTRALFDLHEPGTAIDEFSRALAIDPQCLVAFVYRHLAYADLKMWKKALSDLNQALRLCPDDYRLFAYRAEIKIELRDYSSAFDDLTDAMELDGSIDLVWRRGYVALKLRKSAQAVDDYTEVVLAEPADACAFNNRGLARLQLGNLEDALSDFNKSLELNSAHPDHHNSRARVYLLMGKTDLAMDDSRRALEACDVIFDPGLGDDVVWNDRSEALVRLGRYDEAIRTSEDVLAIQPDDPEAHRFLAEAYSALGNEVAALKFFDRSIELDPDPEVLDRREQLLERLKSHTVSSAVTSPGSDTND